MDEEEANFEHRENARKRKIDETSEQEMLENLWQRRVKQN